MLDQIADLVGIEARLADLDKQIKAAVKAAPTNLPTVRGVGPVVTAVVVGEVGDVARFVDADHFAPTTARHQRRGAAPERDARA